MPKMCHIKHFGYGFIQMVRMTWQICIFLHFWQFVAETNPYFDQNSNDGRYGKKWSASPSASDAILESDCQGSSLPLEYIIMLLIIKIKKMLKSIKQEKKGVKKCINQKRFVHKQKKKKSKKKYRFFTFWFLRTTSQTFEILYHSQEKNRKK